MAGAGIALVATPASASVDMEACVPALKAAEIYRKATRPAYISYRKSWRAAEDGYSEAVGRAREAGDLDTTLRTMDRAKAARDRAQTEARTAYDAVRAPAEAALMKALRRIYPGPTSDKPGIMQGLLTKFLTDCLTRLR